ncbi:MAG: carbohydrate porin [Sedimentisphaerales bacterium]|nr:carbohydrate porin [Sedimentisphaerales bacterium]
MEKRGLITLIAVTQLLWTCLAVHDQNDIREHHRQLSEKGIEFGFGVTNIYQQNVRGGLSKHRKAGRFSGSYDIELTLDAEKLFQLENGIFFLHAEGSWSKSGGIDGPSAGSVFGVNGDAAGRRAFDLTEFWYEQPIFFDNLLIRLGKFDITGGFECHGCPVSFDGSLFANDEVTQFLNSALVNNPSIPFPDNGLGVILHYDVDDFWYISASAMDAQSDVRETGFRTTFHDEDYFFYILETGITPEFGSADKPLQGAYRVGLWNDPQPKANSDNDAAGKYYRDDTGFYISCDQMLKRENTEDDQGLGAFFRYGYAPSRANDVTQFFSFGFQYAGLFEGRDEDVLGVGFAHGTVADTAKMTYNDDYEAVTELYYNVKVTDYLNISPSVQYVMNPGGSQDVSDAVVFGVRAQITF